MTPKPNSGIANVRANGDFTDFAILCEEEKIDVHRVIISGKSPVFYRACTSRFSEATSRTYRIDDFPLAVVERMVEYMYTGDYSSPDEDSTSEENVNHVPVLSVHTTMASIADKYDIQGLVALATEKYANTLENDPDFEKFLDSVADIYCIPAEISQPLRDAAVEFARSAARTAVDSWKGWDKLQEVLSDCPEFSKEFLCSVIQRPVMPILGHCDHCQNWGTKGPVEVLQCRCTNCGKTGGTLGPWE
ncbi:BTB domain-containing protein [Fusarium sp. LHS14.1]|nr:BTB domain-containing protein [Fusarium sp. LHS14.1]